MALTLLASNRTHNLWCNSARHTDGTHYWSDYRRCRTRETGTRFSVDQAVEPCLELNQTYFSTENLVCSSNNVINKSHSLLASTLSFDQQNSYAACRKPEHSLTDVISHFNLAERRINWFDRRVGCERSTEHCGDFLIKKNQKINSWWKKSRRR